MKAYHAFYVGHAMDRGLKHDVFYDDEKLLAFVKKATDDPYYFTGLTVVYGDIVEFEPATYIESFRIKESS